MPQSTPAALPLGTLVALGGGDDDALLALLRDLLPTLDTPVEIVATASSNPARTATAYEKAFRDLGCTAARHLSVNDRNPADAPATLHRLSRAGLVFFTGGDQELITEFIRGTEFLAQLKHRFQTEPAFIVAGTSAGAAALSDYMLVEGYGWRALRKGGIQTVPGLGLLPSLLIDQHFVERGRFGRLMHALLAHPSCLGLGLSEETGIIVRGSTETEVFGDGVVIVVDGGQLQGNNIGRASRGEPVSGQNLQVHLLVAGQQFNLRTRQVTGPEER
ncbi:cyanophycinase [Hymenobacter sp.]|jgi:cyanophycinase|uniref:cyanophycinase n=1 Tax=Hymenobacter sp. TaxID=1898978 RepID=UPI002ED80C47